jgi:hypothetical protein
VACIVSVLSIKILELKEREGGFPKPDLIHCETEKANKTRIYIFFNSPFKRARQLILFKDMLGKKNELSY